METVQVYVPHVQMAVKVHVKDVRAVVRTVVKVDVQQDVKIHVAVVVVETVKVHALIFVQVTAQQVVRRVASLIAETTV